MRKHKGVPRESFVAVDERGNLGKSLKGERHYILVASVFYDDDGFAGVSSHFSKTKGREVKYHDDPELRQPVIRKSSRFLKNVYFVAYLKKPSIHNIPGGMPAEMQESKHIRMMEDLADKVLADIETESVCIDVDHSDLVKDYKVIPCFLLSPYANGKRISCAVNNSADDPILMTHDFIVGLVGDYLRDPGNQDVREMMEYLPRMPIKVHPRKRSSNYLERWKIARK